MAFSRPTLTALRDRALQDVAAAQIYDSVTGQVVNPVLLQFDPLSIAAKIMAGLAYEEYGYLDYIALQATPYTATDEAALSWGGLVGISLRPATPASGTASFTGTAGRDIPQGTALTRGDGVGYTTTADVVVPQSGSATVPFVATSPGASTTITAGAAISLSAPIAGVQSTGVVASSTAPGSDIETVDSLKARYLQRYAAPPQGGSLTDFEEWAMTVPGVTRAWASASVMGPGTVGVYFMLDASEAGAAGYPQGTNGVSPLDNNSRPRDLTHIAAGDQRTLADALIPHQGATQLVYALSPIPTPIAFSIANMGTGNTLANQQAIQTALTEALLAVGTPLGQSLLSSTWNAAIGSVLSQYTLASPIAPVAVPLGHLASVGSISFTS
jgi:uncharacterized phage protein gp47/JayE